MYLEKAKEYGAEQVVLCNDKETGLQAIIVLHDTTFGPAAGGTRLYDYPTEEAALTDAMRLAQGMTRKTAMAKIGVGGAKAVIICDPKKKTEAMLRSYGRFVERLNGVFLTGNDVNIPFEDAQIIAKETQYVLGATDKLGSSSPITAHGVYHGMLACVKEVYGASNMAGLTVAIQGVGAVGLALATELKADGAELIVCDVDKEATAKAAAELGAKVVSLDEIFSVDADIFSPCALGAVLNDETIPQLKCKIIAGGANNQLLKYEHGDELHKRGILYAPDYIVNAGGAIYVRVERENPDATPEILFKSAEEIEATMVEVLAEAKKNNQPTHSTADTMADERVRQEKIRQQK